MPTAPRPAIRSAPRCPAAARVPARTRPAPPRRTSACWLDAPAPKRRVTRSPSSAEISSSSRSQPSSSFQSSLPFHGACGSASVSAAAARGRWNGGWVMSEGSAVSGRQGSGRQRPQHAQPLARRQAPGAEAGLDGSRALEQRGAIGQHYVTPGQHHAVAFARGPQAAHLVRGRRPRRSATGCARSWRRGRTG